MRIWDVAARIGLCAISAACVLSGTSLTAQDILPSVQFNVGAGDWNAGGSWSSGQVPDGDEIVAINSGTASVSSAVPSVGTLGVRGGGILSMNTGGDLSTERTIIGPGGTLLYSGGTLNASALDVTGNVSIDAAVAGDVSYGASWEVANSSNIRGIPANVTLTGDALDRGLALRFGASDTVATVSVSNEPILTIDRATGNASIENVVGGALDLKGYTITSLNGTIGDGWSSLASQGVSGWGEANVTETRFTEYNLSGAESIDVGGSLGIGQLLGEFAPPVMEDVTFEYILGDGTIAAGPVEYTGPLNDLVLQIDPDSGMASISHHAQSLGEFDVIGYTISSPSASLNIDNFTGVGETGWTNTNPQTHALTEVSLENSKVFSNGTDVNLGAIFGGEQDLVFQYALSSGDMAFGTVSYELPDVGGCSPINSLLGDLDGDGEVAFADFLILSGNFGTSVSTYDEGDIDCNGEVDFADFLALSGNFGETLGAAAQSVPEPTGGLLTFVGLMGGLLMFRRKRVAACVVVAVAASTLAMPQSAMAQGLDARFIRVHPDSPNNGLNSIVEARGILNGTVIDMIYNEDLTGSYDIIDLAGDAGTFTTENVAYLNGVNDASMDNFMTYLSGTVTFAAGEYTIGCGSDDGCLINMPGITFDTTFHESGPITEGDGEIIFDPGRGHEWTLGTFVVPSGGVTTPFEALVQRRRRRRQF